jgi:hypothetical protein
MAESEKKPEDVSPEGTEYHSPHSSHGDVEVDWEEVARQGQNGEMHGARPKDLPPAPNMTEVQFQQKNIGVGGPPPHLRDFSGGVMGHWPQLRTAPPPTGTLPHVLEPMWDTSGQPVQNMAGDSPWVVTSTPMGVPESYPMGPMQAEPSVTMGRQVVTDLTRMVERLTTLLTEPRRSGVESVESLCDSRNQARNGQTRSREEQTARGSSEGPQEYLLDSPTDEPPVRGMPRRDSAAPADRMRALGKKYQEPDRFLGEFGTWDVF